MANMAKCPHFRLISGLEKLSQDIQKDEPKIGLATVISFYQLHLQKLQ